MVRLRKERWYSLDGQRRVRRRVQTEVAGMRRVVSLGFLLVLVLILMNRARDPQYISNFFSALGVPLEGSSGSVEQREPSTPERPGRTAPNPSSVAPGRNIASVGTAANRPVATSSPQSRWEAACRDLVGRVLGRATEDQVRCVAWEFFQLPDPVSEGSQGASVGAVPNPSPVGLEIVDPTLLPSGLDTRQALEDVRSASLQELAEVLRRVGRQDGPWRDVVDRFSREWDRLWSILLEDHAVADRPAEAGHRGAEPEGDFGAAEASHLRSTDPGADAGVDADLERALTDWLDQRLMEMLVEASPWKRREGIAFWRLLQRAQGVGRRNSADSLPGPELTTVQLLAEAQRWRGHPVRYRGTVRRCDAVRKACRAFGVRGYAVVWLRGADRSNQPIAVYVPSAMAGELVDRYSSSGEAQVVVDAIVGKKLAYASPAGLQVTTTLFARQVQTGERSAKTNGWLETGPRWWVPYAVGMGASGLIAVLVILTLLKRRGPRAEPRTRGGAAAEDAAKSLALLLVCFAGAAAQPVRAQTADGQGELLPWAESDATERKLELVRSMVVQSIAPEASERFSDEMLGRPVDRLPDAVLKVLHLVERFRVEDLPAGGEFAFGAEDRWALRLGSWSVWCESIVDAPLADDQRDWFDPQANRRVFALQGRLEADGAEAQEQASEGPSDAGVTIWSLDVPQFWLDAAALHQPSRIHGLAWVDRREEGRVLALFCRRPAWIVPRQAVDACRPQLPPEWRQLALGGWDLGWVDVVRRNNQHPIGQEEAPALFSLLRIIDQQSVAEGAVAPAEDPLQVFSAGEDALLKPVRWSVRLVSGSVVEVDDASQRRWLGGDRYFQLDGFVDIGNRRIRYRTQDMPPGESIEFEGEFPVTILVRTPGDLVPEEARRGAVRGWEIGRYAEVQGRFYRMWAYESELMERKASGGRQAAPLVVAHTVRPTVPQIRSSAGSVWFTYALGFALILILGYVLFSAANSLPRRRRRR